MDSPQGADRPAHRPGLAFAHLNLRRNPFGEPLRAERGELAVADRSMLEEWVERLQRPGFAVQFLGGCGRGKTTHLLLQPLLLVNKYDVVLDLQNNRLSRLVRRSLRSTAWGSFDRFSPLPGGERTRRTIEDAGFPLPRVTAGLDLKKPRTNKSSTPC